MENDTQTGAYLIPANGQVQEKTVVIQPGSGKAVGLGVYAATAPNPQYDVEFSPKAIQDDIGLSHERLDIPGQPRYMLLYQIHNFSQRTCKVTMHLRRSAPAGR